MGGSYDYSATTASVVAVNALHGAAVELDQSDSQMLRMQFFDDAPLSGSGNVSCATCHAAITLVISLAIVVTWHVPAWTILVPRWLAQWMYPIDKASLDPLRIMHFLALAVFVVRLVPHGTPGLRSPYLRPLVLCGQHSLEIFCLGVLLSFAAHFIIMEAHGGVALQLLVSLAGIVLMTSAAKIMSWFKHIDGRSRDARPTSAGASGSS